MANETPDSNSYDRSAGVFQQALEEALARLDAVNAELRLAHEKAIDQEIINKEELRRIQYDAEKLAREHFHAEYQQLKETMREDLTVEILEKIIFHGVPAFIVKEALDIPDDMFSNLLRRMGFKSYDQGKPVRVAWDQQGRGGHIYFIREDVMLKFYWEFGGGEVLAVATVPDEANWEKETGLAVSERLTVLKQIGEWIANEQSKPCIYRIKDQFVEWEI